MYANHAKSFATATAVLLAASGTLGEKSARAEPDRAAFVGGARVAAVAPVNGLSPFVGAGLDAGVALPFANRAFVLLATVDYTAPPADGTLAADPRLQGRTTDWKLRTQQLTAGPLFVYRLPPMGRLRLYGGLGPQIAFQKTTAEATAGGSAFGSTTETKNAFGVVLAAGGGFTLGPGALIGELRGNYTGLNHTASGDVGFPAITLHVGYRLEFPAATAPKTARRSAPSTPE